MGKILTVFETAFRYGWCGSTARILDMAKALKDHNWEFTLLTGPTGRGQMAHEQEAVLDGHVIRAPISWPYPALVNRRIPRRIYREWLDITGRARRYRDPEHGWPPKAAEWYLQNVDKSPDVVMGMSTGQVGNFVTARILADHYQVPLILEFQDPCPSLEVKYVPMEEEAALNLSMSKADLVVTTTRGLAEDICERFPHISESVVPLYMCYNDDNPAPINLRINNKVRILHAGMLYGAKGRNVRIVVRALAKAVESMGGIRDTVRLELLGSGPGGVEAKRLAVALGVGELVNVYPEVPMHESLVAMNSADVLLLVKHAEHIYDNQIPGKLFQYIGTGKKIMGVMSPGTEAAEILRKSGLGSIYDHADLIGMTKFIEEIGQENAPEQVQPNWDYIKLFSRSTMGRQFHDSLQLLMSRGPTK